MLHSHLASDAAYLERFRREAHITASIDHPNVIRIFEVGQDGDNYFISMEFLPESLNTMMEAEGRLSPERAVHIVYQVCLGLQAAYDAGVEVHRDIKPQNILLAPDGTMKLTDFGIARAADLSGMTRTGQFMGTPHYMSPEQGKGERADIRTDIYAFGVVLYQMFTGELPFSADTPLAVLRQHIEVTPPSVRQARADLSPALASVVERCLAKDAARRYQTPLELAQALAQALPGAIPVRAPEPVPPAPTTATGSQPTASGTTPASTAPATETPVGSKFCIKCGAGLTPGHKYCVACGAPASGASPAPETPVAAPPAVGRPQTPTPPPPPPPKATPATQPAAPPPAPPTRRGGFPWRLLIPVAGVAGVALIFILISSSGGDGGGGGFVPFPATSMPTPTAALVPVATVALAVTAVPAVTAAPAPTPTPRPVLIATPTFTPTRTPIPTPTPVVSAMSLQITMFPLNGGRVTTSPPIGPGGTFSEGQEVTVTARPNAGYEFVRWSGITASTENPTTVVMSDNLSLVAFFTYILPTPTPTPTRVPTATPTRTPTLTATSVPVTFAAFGPTDGVLVHDPSDNSIEGRSSGVTLEDAIIETRFFNPYSTLEGSWSNGLLFRNSTFNTFHAVVITSSGNWVHSVRTGTVDSPPLQQEFSSDIDTTVNGSNVVQVIALGKPESTEGGRRGSVLKWPEGAPVNLG